MESLKGIITDLHVFLYGGMRTLPLTIAGTMIILGLFTANYAMMFFLMGFLVAVPALSGLLNYIIDFLSVSFKIDWFKTNTSDICNVVIPYSTIDKPAKAEFQNVLCTTSFGMIAFFLGYILTNAIELYKKPQDEDADQTKVFHRTSKTLLAIISIIVFTLIVIWLRVQSSCDSMSGSLIGAVAFGALGYGWYTMLSKVSDGRLADLFGISNRILPKSAIKPVACVVDPNA